ncbi:ATP-binding protein [Ruminococcus flavefaciens]|uniref:DNA polymerase-3 subunit delta n=1 Tax=Ruminococcus flavefaciens TaxID=1265 RepID=A0A315YLP4_RUMFL|nr:DNA polymerase III subunit delta' [Ruminococcus flavefaciens]PWJ12586.1 DNA polymerase-3 subunit delta' [Ruminococcus flavefaciens]SSA49065.1 DNA polymerase-3 subunit delta' [Ruminococcus flavefaciens]
MKKIYGNRALLDILAGMSRSGRTAHSVMICGEKGTGRKLMAKYYTQALMCEFPHEGIPCGECNACLNVEKGIHPDVIYPEKSGKLGGYSVNCAREVIADAYVKPNNSSGCKVYIFADCHNVDTRTQNTLLKLIEEPPEYAYFIFTCGSKSEFLPTIISRCVCLSTSPCTEDEAEQALTDMGYDSSDIKAAVECFHGNIGMCESYITDEELRKRVDLTKAIADSIIRKDEYSLAADLFSAGKERNDVREVLSMLDKLFRDAAVLSRDRNAAVIGCSGAAARALSQTVTPSQAARLHERTEKAWAAVESNVSIPLALTALGAEIMDIVAQTFR